ncbi:DNA polymerase III subunit [Emticicia fluvialis]|uniref:DNA polymerase III subunit n=1 Tax=Emticicia fluvialis TaxID=2974474 RepID=UPI0021659CAB|nr:DNA polymerase III subunit delta [Emticicia fluvialis]
MLFREITGLEDIKQSLIGTVANNHVAHAQLFHGNEGTANLALALAYATYINCEDKQSDDACGRCASCIKMSKLAHPDVNYIFPTAGGKSVLSENFMSQWRAFVNETPYGNLPDWLEKIGVKQGNIPAEEARQLIQKLSLKSYEGGYKIVIIWQAEYLHNTTANALLKILEEPPEQTLFLLVVNSMERLLTTIISRTQRVAVRKFTEQEIISYLLKYRDMPHERAKQIAFLSEGNMHSVLEMIDKAEDNDHAWFANWMRMCYATNVSKLVPMADEFDTKSKEQKKAMLEYGLSLFREMFLYTNGGESLVRLENEELVFVRRFSAAINLSNLEQITELFSEAHYHIERNARAKILFLDISLMIARLMAKA